MQKEDVEMIIDIKPWVKLGDNGTPFMGPPLRDLLLAYYITQGENEATAKKFVEAHISGIYARL